MLSLVNCYIVKLLKLLSKCNLSIYVLYSALVIKHHRGRRPTKQGRMSQSQFGCVHKHGVIFKKLGIGSLVLTLKPDIDFETVSRCITRLAIVHYQQRTTSL